MSCRGSQSALTSIAKHRHALPCHRHEHLEQRKIQSHRIYCTKRGALISIACNAACQQFFAPCFVRANLHSFIDLSIFPGVVASSPLPSRRRTPHLRASRRPSVSFQRSCGAMLVFCLATPSTTMYSVATANIRQTLKIRANPVRPHAKKTLSTPIASLLGHHREETCLAFASRCSGHRPRDS